MRLENDVSLAHAHATKQRDAKRERGSFFAPLSSRPSSHVTSLVLRALLDGAESFLIINYVNC